MTPQHWSIALCKLPAIPCAQWSCLCYHMLTGSTATDTFETPLPLLPLVTGLQSFTRELLTPRPNPDLSRETATRVSLGKKWSVMTYGHSEMNLMLVPQVQLAAPPCMCWALSLSLLGLPDSWPSKVPQLARDSWPCLHMWFQAPEIPERNTEFTAFASKNI